MSFHHLSRKCLQSQYRLGKGHKECPLLNVHEKVIKESESKKYLSYMGDTTGSINTTKGQGIITGIMSILNDIPLGRHSMDIEMKLREVILLNVILYNTEAWQGLTEAHVKSLQAIGEDLLCRILIAY